MILLNLIYNSYVRHFHVENHEIEAQTLVKLFLDKFFSPVIVFSFL